MAHEVEIHGEATQHARRHYPRAIRVRRAQLVSLRSFLIKVAINTLVLAFTLPMLPGLVVHDARVWSYLAIGLTLSLVNRILKPVLQVFNGHLILWHRLAWQTVIITVVLVLSFMLSGIEATFVELHWPVVDAVLLSLVLTLADALLGFDRPQVLHGSPDRSIWRLADRFPGLRRSRLLKQLRLAQVYEIVWSYGIEIAVGRSPLRHIRAHTSRWITGRASSLDSMTVPQKVTQMLEQLGPLYVKLGQVVSSQSSALPEEWRAELDKLQSTVAPFPYAEARAVISAELGAPPEQLFATIDETPLAAASTAQVHRATLKDNSEVVVKVQRPDITSKVWTDLQIMRELAVRLERRFDWARQLDLSAVVAVYAEGVIRELDYRNELYHGVRLADAMAPLPGVHVPLVYRELSTSKVLTMELVKGVKINRLSEPQTGALDRDALVRTLLRAIVKQLLIDGFFHGDPHPGNVYVVAETGTIIFLDLGMMGELSGEQRRDLLELVFALQQGDTVILAGVLRRLSRQSRQLDEAAFRMAVARVYAQEWTYGGTPSFSALMTTMLSVLSQHGLRFDEGLTLAIKAMMQAETAVTTLAPHSDVFAIITEETKSLLGEQWAPGRVVDAVETQLRRSGSELLRRLPGLADATMLWLDQYQRGTIGVSVSAGDLPQRIGSLSTILSSGFRQLAIGIALCGMVIGAAIGLGLLRAPDGSGWHELFGLAVFGFIGVLVFSAVTITMLLRSPGQRDDAKGLYKEGMQ